MTADDYIEVKIETGNRIPYGESKYMYITSLYFQTTFKDIFSNIVLVLVLVPFNICTVTLKRFSL